MRWLAAFLASLAVIAVAWVGWPSVAATAHVATEAARRAGTLASLRDWPRMQTPEFTVYYPVGAGTQADIVAAVADTYYPQVAADFGIAHSGRHVIVVLSAAQMLQLAGPGTSAPPLGIYNYGVVWLLEPSAFLPSGAGLEASYAAQGPVPHELTHLADDLASAGRIPRWLDEGIAQYEEWRLNGYVWRQSDNSFSLPTYTWNQLSADFVNLPNQAMAYRQALAAATLICGEGQGTCVHVLHLLAQGTSVNAALDAVIGPRPLGRLEAGAAWPAGWRPAWTRQTAPAP